jgi:hypothetical protein
MSDFGKSQRGYPILSLENSGCAILSLSSLPLHVYLIPMDEDTKNSETTGITEAARIAERARAQREQFEQHYRQWITLVASDIALPMKNAERSVIEAVLNRCEQYRGDPPSMYTAIPGDLRARLERLVGSDRLQGILLLSTDMVAFSPSIFMQRQNILDYAIAMNRRFFFRIYWFPIIVINQAFIEQADERMLHFLLEHELVQNEMYTEHVTAHGCRPLSSDEKRAIDGQALQQAIERSGITQEEHIREHELMQEISMSAPPVPKTFAETSLYEYLDRHWEEIKDLGVKGETESEAEFEAMVAQEHGWIDFSHEIYGLFLTELKRKLDVTYHEYGYV